VLVSCGITLHDDRFYERYMYSLIRGVASNERRLSKRTTPPADHDAGGVLGTSHALTKTTANDKEGKKEGK
jgi:hypothetical protein